MGRVEISDDEGNKYDMASSLTTYLVNRKSIKFNFGDWLQSLTDAQIHRLLELDYAAGLPDNTAMAHIFQIALIALAAELHTKSVTLGPETISYVGILAGYESLRRNGFVQLKHQLRLSEPYNITISVTDEGLEAGQRWYASITKH